MLAAFGDLGRHSVKAQLKYQNLRSYGFWGHSISAKFVLKFFVIYLIRNGRFKIQEMLGQKRGKELISRQCSMLGNIASEVKHGRLYFLTLNYFRMTSHIINIENSIKVLDTTSFFTWTFVVFSLDYSVENLFMMCHNSFLVLPRNLLSIESFQEMFFASDNTYCQRTF